MAGRLLGWGCRLAVRRGRCWRRRRTPTMRPAGRLLVAAHYLDGVQYEDLAEMFGLPLGTVKTHLHRGLLRLRSKIESEGRP